MLEGVKQQERHMVSRLQNAHRNPADVLYPGSLPESVLQDVERIQGGVVLRKELPMALDHEVAQIVPRLVGVSVIRLLAGEAEFQQRRMELRIIGIGDIQILVRGDAGVRLGIGLTAEKALDDQRLKALITERLICFEKSLRPLRLQRRLLQR